MEIDNYQKGMWVSESRGMIGQDIFIPFLTDVIVTDYDGKQFETVILDLELSKDIESDDILHFKNGGSIGMGWVKFIELKNKND